MSIRSIEQTYHNLIKTDSVDEFISVFTQSFFVLYSMLLESGKITSYNEFSDYILNLQVDDCLVNGATEILTYLLENYRINIDFSLIYERLMDFDDADEDEQSMLQEIICKGSLKDVMNELLENSGSFGSDVEYVEIMKTVSMIQSQCSKKSIANKRKRTIKESLLHLEEESLPKSLKEEIIKSLKRKLDEEDVDDLSDQFKSLKSSFGKRSKKYFV